MGYDMCHLKDHEQYHCHLKKRPESKSQNGNACACWYIASLLVEEEGNIV